MDKEMCEGCPHLPEEEAAKQRLSREQVNEKLKPTKGWTLDGKELKKEFKFKNFVKALEFVNEVGKIAERVQHHPDIFMHNWNRVRIQTTTHDVGHALTERDFKLVAEIDKIDKKESL